jgi:hypothetical protein
MNDYGSYMGFTDIHYGSDYDLDDTIKRFLDEFKNSDHSDFFGEEEKVEPIVEKKIPEFSFVK